MDKYVSLSNEFVNTKIGIKPDLIVIKLKLGGFYDLKAL
jgi:hypothetical protein